MNQQSVALGTERSVIREIFEYGNRRAKEIGRENVFDFSLGNPAVPTPACINDAIGRLARETSFSVHGYTSAPGAPQVRRSIAADYSARFGVTVSADDLYMTCGAAASLTVALHALCEPGDEVVALAPFFPEYRVFTEGAQASFVAVDADTDHFQINFSALERALSAATKAVIINSPNNPSGAVLRRETLERLCDLLRAHAARCGHPVYLLSDEPYREIVYGDVKVPSVLPLYEYSIICYSYSKSLSLAGERIGYILINPSMPAHDTVYAAVCGAGRKLGFVCAPALMQYAIAAHPAAIADISAYRVNRDLLYGALTSYGYHCVRPDGAFYLFVKSPLASAKEFCDLAKRLDLLLVPSDSFGVPGYARISYCVSEQMIRRSLPLFEQLIQMLP